MSCTSFSVIQPITVNLQVEAMLKQPGSRSATVGLDSSEADLDGAGYHNLDYRGLIFNLRDGEANTLKPSPPVTRGGGEGTLSSDNEVSA